MIGKAILLRQWWYKRVIFPDPYLVNFYYALSMLITIGCVGFLFYLLHWPQLLWGLIASYFTSIANVGVGYVARLKRSLCCSILCVLAIFLGGVLGSYSWSYGIALFVFGTGTFALASRALEDFLPFLMPFIVFVISGSHPTSLMMSIERVQYGVIAAFLAILICNHLRPYNTRIAIKKIKASLLVSYQRYFDMIFMTPFSSFNQETLLHKTRSEVVGKIFLLNKHLRYFDNSETDKKAKAYYTLFSEGYLLSRLLCELKTTGDFQLIQKLNDLQALIQTFFKAENIQNGFDILNKMQLSSSDDRHLVAIEQVIKNIGMTLQGLLS